MRSLAFFFFNDTATTEIYTLSLHDALPISPGVGAHPAGTPVGVEQHLADRLVGLHVHAHGAHRGADPPAHVRDRKSTRLNSSHANISYAVFCLKKKKKVELNYSQTQ